jgi:hypothetical protein
LHRTLGGTHGRSGRVRKISPSSGIGSPDRPDWSESLYRLSYRGPHCEMLVIIMLTVHCLLCCYVTVGHVRTDNRQGAHFKVLSTEFRFDHVPSFAQLTDQSSVATWVEKCKGAIVARGEIVDTVQQLTFVRTLQGALDERVVGSGRHWHFCVFWFPLHVRVACWLILLSTCVGLT